ncbi:MAG: hypothetical protein AB7F59_05175 [Bdellovibrionales bacterium]
MSSSSKAVEPYWGLYRSERGFSVDGRSTGWKIAEGPEDSPHVLALFKSVDSAGQRPATLSVRIDDNTQKLRPPNYIKSWLLLYHRLGLDVKGHQPFLHNGEKGYVLDVVDRKLSTQSRQALFFRGTQVVILTCSDAKASFTNALPTCNKLIRSFKWSEDSSLSLTK